MGEPISIGFDEGREPDYTCLTAMRCAKIGLLDATEIIDVMFFEPHDGPFDVENERVS